MKFQKNQQKREGEVTDGYNDTMKEIFQPMLEEFKDLIGKSEDKKSFIGGLIKIFPVLLTSRGSKKFQKQVQKFS